MGEHGAALGDILLYSRDDIEGTTLMLKGDRETVRAYLRKVKSFAKKGHLSIVRQDVYKNQKGDEKRQLPPKLDSDTIEKIARRLPVKPWPKGIHKKIANDLAVSNTQCSRAINLILSDDSLSLLIGTDESV